MIPFLVMIFFKHCLTLELKICSDSNFTITQHDYICKNDQNYDKTKLPGTLPLILESNLFIRDVTKVNEEDNSITLHTWINVVWNDPGLSFVKNPM